MRPSSTCISPCVAFNNHDGSTKSYDYVREHNEAVNRLDFIAGREADHRRVCAPARCEMVTQHDGSVLRLRKLADDYDAHDRIAAMNLPAGAPRSRRNRDRAALCRSEAATTCTHH